MLMFIKLLVYFKFKICMQWTVVSMEKLWSYTYVFPESTLNYCTEQIVSGYLIC